MKHSAMNIHWHMIKYLVLVAALTGINAGCLRYLTHERAAVLLPGVDINQTLRVAAIELEKNTWGCVLGVWVIRDQVITPAQAETIDTLYFSHIDSLRQNFNIWHLTWAIADLYRNGDDAIRAVLQKAYDDARLRAKKLGGTADRFANSDTLFMGDAHSLGRLYAERHVVVPGNPKYLQSFDDYLIHHPDKVKHSL
jgi:hypothetical protein